MSSQVPTISVKQMSEDEQKSCQEDKSVSADTRNWKPVAFSTEATMSEVLPSSHEIESNVKSYLGKCSSLLQGGAEKAGLCLGKGNTAGVKYCESDNRYYVAAKNFISYTAKELHGLLGHASVDRMRKFLQQTNDITLTGKLSDLEKCDVCAQIDMTNRNPPSSTQKITKDMPNKCFVDTWFAGDVPSLAGATCAHDVMDAKTGMVKTFPMASKGGFLVVLQCIVQVMYAQYGRELHQLNTDNAWELGAGINASEEIKRWIADRQIHHLTTAPYAHYQIGTGERLHRTLNKGMRAALHTSGCPDAFWALAR